MGVLLGVDGCGILSLMGVAGMFSLPVLSMTLYRQRNKKHHQQPTVLNSMLLTGILGRGGVTSD